MTASIAPSPSASDTGKTSGQYDLPHTIPRSANTRPLITLAEEMERGRGTGGDGGRKGLACRGKVSTLP